MHCTKKASALKGWLTYFIVIAVLATLSCGFMAYAAYDGDKRQQAAVDQARGYIGTWRVGRISSESWGYDMVLLPTETTKHANRVHLYFVVSHPDEAVLNTLCPGDTIRLSYQDRIEGTGRLRASGHLRISRL
jgi:hypothetical protein